MPGETDLKQIVASLQPELSNESFVFAVIEETQLSQFPKPFATIRETEGLSFICETQVARENGLPCNTTFRKITLKVHSSLTAVGLTALVSTTLAESGIPCNVVAGYYHDHLFVPEDRAEDAFQLLSNLANPKTFKPSP